MRILALIAFLFSLALPSSLAQDETVDQSQIVYPKSAPSDEQSESASTPYADLVAEGASPVGMVVTVLGYLIILGGMAVVAWYLFKRGVIRKPFANSEGKLKVAESRMLGNRQYIMVVEYEDNRILLGVGPGKIDYLTSLNGYRNEFPNLEPQSDKKSMQETA
jgi:flagellar biosynthetic protein FliO